MKNHGVLTYGTTLPKEYTTACRIDIAKIYFPALQIGTPNILTQEKLDEIKAAYLSIK